MPDPTLYKDFIRRLSQISNKGMTLNYVGFGRHNNDVALYGTHEAHSVQHASTDSRNDVHTRHTFQHTILFNMC